MQLKKLNLTELKVQSFITQSNNNFSKTIKGGEPQTNLDCSRNCSLLCTKVDAGCDTDSPSDCSASHTSTNGGVGKGVTRDTIIAV